MDRKTRGTLVRANESKTNTNTYHIVDEFTIIGSDDQTPSDNRMLFICDESICPRHALLQMSGDNIQIMDLASNNGTFIGSKRIEFGTWHKIENDAQLKLGNYALKFSLGACEKSEGLPCDDSSNMSTEVINANDNNLHSRINDAENDHDDDDEEDVILSSQEECAAPPPTSSAVDESIIAFDTQKLTSRRKDSLDNLFDDSTNCSYVDAEPITIPETQFPEIGDCHDSDSDSMMSDDHINLSAEKAEDVLQTSADDNASELIQIDDYDVNGDAIADSLPGKSKTTTTDHNITVKTTSPIKVMGFCDTEDSTECDSFVESHIININEDENTKMADLTDKNSSEAKIEEISNRLTSKECDKDKSVVNLEEDSHSRDAKTLLACVQQEIEQDDVLTQMFCPAIGTVSPIKAQNCSNNSFSSDKENNCEPNDEDEHDYDNMLTQIMSPKKSVFVHKISSKAKALQEQIEDDKMSVIKKSPGDNAVPETEIFNPNIKIKQEKLTQAPGDNVRTEKVQFSPSLKMKQEILTQAQEPNLVDLHNIPTQRYPVQQCLFSPKTADITNENSSDDDYLHNMLTQKTYEVFAPRKLMDVPEVDEVEARDESLSPVSLDSANKSDKKLKTKKLSTDSKSTSKVVKKKKSPKKATKVEQFEESYTEIFPTKISRPQKMFDSSDDELEEAKEEAKESIKKLISPKNESVLMKEIEEKNAKSHLSPKNGKLSCNSLLQSNCYDYLFNNSAEISQTPDHIRSALGNNEKMVNVKQMLEQKKTLEQASRSVQIGSSSDSDDEALANLGSKGKKTKSIMKFDSSKTLGGIVKPKLKRSIEGRSSIRNPKMLKNPMHTYNLNAAKKSPVVAPKGKGQLNKSLSPKQKEDSKSKKSIAVKESVDKIPFIQPLSLCRGDEATAAKVVKNKTGMLSTTRRVNHATIANPIKTVSTETNLVGDMHVPSHKDEKSKKETSIVMPKSILKKTNDTDIFDNYDFYEEKLKQTGKSRTRIVSTKIPPKAQESGQKMPGKAPGREVVTSPVQRRISEKDMPKELLKQRCTVKGAEQPSVINIGDHNGVVQKGNQQRPRRNVKKPVVIEISDTEENNVYAEPPPLPSTTKRTVTKQPNRAINPEFGAGVAVEQQDRKRILRKRKDSEDSANEASSKRTKMTTVAAKWAVISEKNKHVSENGAKKSTRTVAEPIAEARDKYFVKEEDPIKISLKRNVPLKRDDLAPAVLAKGRKNPPRQCANKFIFSKTDSSNYSSLIKKFGGEIVDDILEATVLVSPKQLVRTPKILSAICRGIPIVSTDYLISCKLTNGFPDADEYIIKDEIFERMFKFDLRTSLAVAKRKSMFQNYRIFVTPHTRPTPAELCVIFAASGGQLLRHNETLPRRCEKYFAVSCREDKKYYTKLREKYKDIQIISQEGLMVCVLQQYLNLRNFLLE